MKYYDFVVEPIVNLIDKNTDCVIEFGSGWGRNIYYIDNKLQRKDIDYYAFEYTKEGCNMTNILTKYLQNEFQHSLMLHPLKFCLFCINPTVRYQRCTYLFALIFPSLL